MQVLHVEWKWNIPNVLSLVRIALIPVFMVLYMTGYDEWAFVALAVSGLTDVLDGFIARRFNQITDCGKLLDPLSDKLTQVAVVVALTTRYLELLPLAVLCLVKEACQAIGGIILLRRRYAVRGSKWFGKLSTVMFYSCMLALVLFEQRMPDVVEWILISAAGLSMLLAFFGYLRMFIAIRREPTNTQETSVASDAVET